MTLTTVGLALKRPEQDRNSLLLKGAMQLRHFPKAPVKREYVVLRKTLVDDRRALAAWIAKGVAFAVRGTTDFVKTLLGDATEGY